MIFLVRKWNFITIKLYLFDVLVLFCSAHDSEWFEEDLELFGCQAISKENFTYFYFMPCRNWDSRAKFEGLEEGSTAEDPGDNCF